MNYFPESTKPVVVSQIGASVGSILRGTTFNNQGLRLRILQAQKKGDDGPIRGAFVLLSLGESRHAASLSHLLGQLTNAADVLVAIRQHSPACVHVVNTGSLAIEVTRAEGVVSDPDASTAEWVSPASESRRTVPTKVASSGAEELS